MRNRGWLPTILTLLFALLLGACPPGPNGNGDGNGGENGGDEEGSIRPEVQAMRARLEAAQEKIDKDAVERSHDPGVLPFDLRLEEVTIPDAPGLHSYAAAVVEEGPHKGSWLLLGGRTNGLHNLTGHSFPTQERNTNVWVVDPGDGGEGSRVCSAPLQGLLQNLYDALAATNHQSTQVGDVLWIDGGYGWSENLQDNGTFGYLIAVDVPGLVAAVLESCGEPLPDVADFFSYGSLGDDCLLFGPKTSGGDCSLTVTGGGMERVGDDLFLAFGQRFGGRYNDFLNQQQIYACQVVSFAPPEPSWGGSFEIGEVTVVARGGEECPPGGLVPNDDPFHRRDLNVVPGIYLDDGGEAAEALFTYGGVFRLEFFAFHEPLYVTAAGATVDHGFEQRIGQYETAQVALFDRRSGTQHTVLLGGISQSYCTEDQSGVATPQCTKSKKILGLAGFVEDGTILSCQGGKADSGDFTCSGTEQILLYRPFLTDNPDLPTGMLGTNASFFRDPDVAAHSNDVIELEALPAGEYTTVGWIFGGIEVSGKVPGQPFLHDKTRSETIAGSRAFAVRIRPLS